MFQFVNLNDLTKLFHTNVNLISSTDFDECQHIKPCQHNGTCLNNEGSYYCQCTVGWTGHDCETGTLPSLFPSVCFGVFYLQKCRLFNYIVTANILNTFPILLDENECENSPCKHEGACINNEGSYFCNCTEGWQGHDCEKGGSIISKLISVQKHRDLYSAN